MLRKPIDIPPEAAREFLKDMRAFFRTKGHEADRIAADAGWKLEQHMPRGTRLRLSDVKKLFYEMKDTV